MQQYSSLNNGVFKHNPQNISALGKLPGVCSARKRVCVCGGGGCGGKFGGNLLLFATSILYT